LWNKVSQTVFSQCATYQDRGPIHNNNGTLASTYQSGEETLMILRIVVAIAALMFGAAAVSAQDVIAERKALMKTQGAQTAQGAKFMKGEEPFDLAKAQVIFTTLANTSEKISALFPDNSKTGGDTASLPAIWEKMDDFKAIAAKLAADAIAAQASVTDEASFKATFPQVTKSCGGCHQPYRAKKD
jgi:cytochrome c556